MDSPLGYSRKLIIQYLTDESQCIGVEGASYLSAPASSLRCPSRLCAWPPTVHYLYLLMSCPTAACVCMQMIFSCIGLYILLLTIKLCRLTLLSDWISAHMLQFNCDTGKCKCMLVSRKRDATMPITLLVNGQPLERVYSYKSLRILLMSWSAHIYIYTLFQNPTTNWHALLQIL